MYFDLRLWGMTRGLRGRIALAALVGLLGLPANLGRLALAGVILAAVIQGRPVQELLPQILAAVLLIGARALLLYWKEEICNRTAAEMKIRLRRKLYEHVLALGPGPFDQARTGGVLLSLVEGVEVLETFFGQYLPQFILAVLTPVVVFAFMAWLDLRTALVLLAFSLFTLVVPYLFHRWNAVSSMARRDAYAALGAEFLDALQGLATLKIFGQSQRRGRLLAEKARHLYRATMMVLAANIATSGVTVLGISAGAAVALGWGAVRVEHGELELRTLVIVLMLGVEVFRPLRDLVSVYHRGMIAMAATKGIYAILDSVPEVTDRPGAAAPAALAPEVRCENVTFGYPGRRTLALRDVSFTLRAGETLGVVGPSGAGKSTLVWLLLRFFDPQQGRVLLGGQDLRDLPLDALRRQFGVVTQDTYLFHGTVADNLRLGKPDATQAELEAAARTANAHEFIMALPHGYDTLVGERGSRLSGGQRQRIAIARALLKDAPILLLDEALSSVDSENEALIQEALDRLQRGRTTLVIAHRLSSVVNADRILVLDEGRVVETGRHAELIAAGGTYARLMARQASEARVATLDGNGAREGLDVAGWAPAGDGNGAARPHAAHGLMADGHGHSHDHGPPRPAISSEMAPSASSLPSLELWARLLRLVRPWWWQQVLVFLLGLAHASAFVLLSVMSAIVVRQVAVGADLTRWLWLLGVLVPLAAFLTWAESWLAHDLAYRLLAEMRIDLYQKLEPLAPAYLLRRRSGDVISAVTADVEQIEYFFAHTIAPLFVAILVPGAVLIILGWISWPLALVLLPFLAVVSLTPAVARVGAERLGHQVRTRLGELSASMVDSVQGLRTVAAFRAGPSRLAEIERLGRRLNQAQLGFLRHQTVQNAVIEGMTALGGLAVLITGAVLVGQGRAPAALLPLATLTALAAFHPVSELVKTMKQLADTLGSARRIFAVHDEPVVLHDGPGVRLDPRAAPSAAWDNVSFAYGPAEPQALHEVAFRAEPGQTLAIVGRSGAGKTTAAHLLLRFWDPQEGRMLLGEHDLREFVIDDLRRHVALVAQDTYLFNATLRENIALARPDADIEEVRRAARLANIHDFIESLPDGYETMVGERGVQLSGGQRQRVAIARAVLEDAPVLVLDEATSHLDAENERLVREALDRLMQGRTTIVIAHRLSTVRSARRIVVLDHGRVVEQGSHDELLKRQGIYARLVSAQIVEVRGSA